MNQDTNVSYNASGEDISNKRKRQEQQENKSFPRMSIILGNSIECTVYRLSVNEW